MIELSRVSKIYEAGSKTAKDISLTARDGEFVSIMGRSGSDKSILMKLLFKELEPIKGHIVVNGMGLRKMPRRYIPKYRRRLGMVFQNFRLLKGRTVSEDVAFAQRVVRAPIQVIKETVPEVLRLVGLSSRYRTYPRQLSDGEQRRIIIARAPINNPEVLLAGESTGNLNSFDTYGVMKLLEEINQRGITVTMVTYSQETVDEMNKRIITMERGTIISDEGGYYSEYQGLLEIDPGSLVPG